MAGLFGGGQRTPKPEPPSRMPDPMDPRILEAQRRRRLDAGQRTGRLDTILSSALRETMGTRGRLGA